MAFTQAKLEHALGSWVDLNIALMKSKGREGLRFALELLDLEQKGKARPEFLRRILGRATRLRGDVDRADLMRQINLGRSRRQ